MRHMIFSKKIATNQIVPKSINKLKCRLHSLLTFNRPSTSFPVLDTVYNAMEIRNTTSVYSHNLNAPLVIRPKRPVRNERHQRSLYSMNYTLWTAFSNIECWLVLSARSHHVRGRVQHLLYFVCAQTPDAKRAIRVSHMCVCSISTCTHWAPGKRHCIRCVTVGSGVIYTPGLSVYVRNQMHL